MVRRAPDGAAAGRTPCRSACRPGGGCATRRRCSYTTVGRGDHSTFMLLGLDALCRQRGRIRSGGRLCRRHPRLYRFARGAGLSPPHRRDRAALGAAIYARGLPPPVTGVRGPIIPNLVVPLDETGPTRPTRRRPRMVPVTGSTNGSRRSPYGDAESAAPAPGYIAPRSTGSGQRRPTAQRVGPEPSRRCCRPRTGRATGATCFRARMVGRPSAGASRCSDEGQAAESRPGAAVAASTTPRATAMAMAGMSMARTSRRRSGRR